MRLVILTAAGAFIGGIALIVFSRVVEGEISAAFNEWLKRRVVRAAERLPSRSAGDQESEWLEELGALRDRPIQALRFVCGLSAAADGIATGLDVGLTLRRRFLLWVAGVEVRDIVCASDRARYETVGVFLLAQFFVVSAGAGLVFLLLPVAGELNPVPRDVLMGMVAVLFALTKVGFDRAYGCAELSRRRPGRWIARFSMRVLLSIVLAGATASGIAAQLYTPSAAERAAAGGVTTRFEVAHPRSASARAASTRGAAAGTGYSRADTRDGLIERIAGLDSLFARDPVALANFVLVAALLLALDLMAPLPSVSGRNSVYAQRQRLRRAVSPGP